MARTADDVRRLPAGEGHRLPPHNIEAEASVLGAMLLSNEAVADVVEILESDDFYRSAHGRIYAALRGLFARGEPIDIVSAAAALERDGSLDDIGGRLYLADLANEVPTPASAAYYAEIVSKAALRRRLISAAADIMDRAYASTDDAEASPTTPSSASTRSRAVRTATRWPCSATSSTRRCSTSSRSRPASRPTPACRRGSSTSTTSRRACSRAT